MGEWDPDVVSNSIDQFQTSLQKTISYKTEIDALISEKNLKVIKQRILQMKKELLELNPNSWQWELLFDGIEEKIFEIEEFGWE